MLSHFIKSSRENVTRSLSDFIIPHGQVSILNLAILLVSAVLLYSCINIASEFFKSQNLHSGSRQHLASLLTTDEKQDSRHSAPLIIDGTGKAVTALYRPSVNVKSTRYPAENNSLSSIEPKVKTLLITEAGSDSFSNKVTSRSSNPQQKRPQASSNQKTTDPLASGPFGSFIIAGQVMDETGWPVPGIEVVAVVSRLFDEQVNFNLKPGTQIQSSVTNGTGMFLLPGLAEGEYTVHTVASDFYPDETQTISRTGNDSIKLIVVEQHKVTLYGQVESSSGQSIAGVEVVPLSDPSLATKTGPDGFYALTANIKRNSGYAVQFWAEGYQEQILRLSSSETIGVNEVERSIALQSDKGLVTVSGSLSSSGGSIAGEKVSLKSASTKRKYDGIADNSGNFIIPDVEIGDDYILWVSPQGPYEFYRRNNFVIPAGGLSNLAIALKSLGIGSLSGQMIDFSGNPIPNFSLFLQSSSSTTSQLTITGNSAGFFNAENVLEGKLTLGTSALPKLRVSGIELQEGIEKDVDLVLDVGNYAINGQVTDSFGDPIPTANLILIWVYQNNGITYESVHRSSSSSTGDFRFSKLGPGPRTLTIAAPGYFTTNIPYEVGMSGGQAISVQLEPNSGG